MKRKIRIESEIETNDYHNVGESEADTRELVSAMLKGEADWPDYPKIYVDPTPSVFVKTLQDTEIALSAIDLSQPLGEAEATLDITVQNIREILEKNSH